MEQAQDNEQYRRNLAPNKKVAVAKAERRRGRLTVEESKMRKRKMLKSLRKSLGNVEMATRESGVPRRTHFFWMKSDAAYARRVVDIVETQKDLVEGQLLNNCKKGKERSIFFYLSTKAKDRGYGGVKMNDVPGMMGLPTQPDEKAEVFTLESLVEKVSQPTITRVLERLHARDNRREKCRTQRS